MLAIAENLRLRPLAAYLRAMLRRAGAYTSVSGIQVPAAAEGEVGAGAPAAPLPLELPDLALDLGLPYTIGALPAEEEEEGDTAGDGPSESLADEPALLDAARASGLRAYLRTHVLPGVVPTGLLPATWDGAGLCEEEEEGRDGGPLVEGLGSDEGPAPPPFHDLEVRVGGRAFRAHRLFLCGRSRFIDSALRFEARGQGGGGGGVARLSLDDVSAPVFGLLLEWMYLDALRPRLPLWAVAEALVASDVLALADGLRALLVQQVRGEGAGGGATRSAPRCRHCRDRHSSRTTQACSHVSPASVVGLLRLADLLDLHRLTSACARCVARNLDATLADPDFRDLIAENAAGITRREAVDSVPMLDEVRSELRRLRAAACGGSAARVYAAGGVVEHAAAHAEFDRRFGALQVRKRRLFFVVRALCFNAMHNAGF